jgi:hypothetical protein
MSTTPFSDTRTRRNGRSKPSGALTEANHRSRVGSRKHSETSFGFIALTAKRAYVLAAEADQNDACEDEMNALFDFLTTEPAICPTA